MDGRLNIWVGCGCMMPGGCGYAGDSELDFQVMKGSGVAGWSCSGSKDGV